MLYICDFYVNDKEAVSNQIELLRKRTRGKVFAASIFMGQKTLQFSDIRSGRWILPEVHYEALLPRITKLAKNGIHYFEEEPSAARREAFNNSGSALYISMYRRPTSEYVEHLKKYSHLRKIFVELESHREILLAGGIKPGTLEVMPTPGLFKPAQAERKYTPTSIKLVFASWNNAEPNALDDRGLLFILELLRTNSNASLTIPIRDTKTEEFLSIAKRMGVAERVELIMPKDRTELHNMYKNCDFVIFVPKKRVTKDVPNSIIDGLLCGKPCIVSTLIDFSTVVAVQDIGIVLTNHEKVVDLRSEPKDYARMSMNALKYAERHTDDAYTEILTHYEAR